MDSKDKRHFKRYIKEVDFDLKLKDKTFRAKTTDYSLDGVGAIIEDTPPIRNGDVINIDIKRPDIKTAGEVIWSRNGVSGFRIGVRNMGTLKGFIKDFELADTLIGLQRSHKTGILTIESGAVIKRVYIKNGDMIFAASNREADRLGDVLLREGRITPEQFDHSVREMNRTKQRHGAVLVSLGYLTPQELVTAVKHYVEEVIVSLFSLGEGGFIFEESPLPTEEVITLKLSAANLIYYGIKRIKNFEHIIGEMPSEESVLAFSADPLDLFQDLRLDDSGKRIFSCINGMTSVNDIILITQLDRAEALKTVYALMNVRMIEVKHKGEPSVEMPQQVISEIIEERDVTTADPHLRELVEEMYGKYETMGYYGVLGVKDFASTPEIKSAYYKAAKKYHPDMHFYHMDDSFKAKLSDIFSYIYDAYATLSDPKKRREYDKAITLKPAKLTAGQDKASAKFEEGKVRLKKNEFQEAEQLFGQATYFDRTIAEYHYYYGLTLIKLNKLKDAEKAIGRALKLDPANADYLAELGFIYLGLGFPTAAKGFFERALKSSPGNVRASAGLAKVRDNKADR